MKRWPSMSLGEVCFAKSGNSKIIKGTLATSNDGTLFPAFSATGQDVFSDGYDYDGDGIVISAVGARCGKCFLASGKWRGIANTHVILAKPDKANVRFLWYLLNDESFWVKGGTAQPFVKVGDSLKKQIAVPPLAEQERIVKLLDEADELRKLRTQADRRTAKLIPALFHEMFGDRQFPTATVLELAAERDGSIRTGPFGSDLRHSEFVDSGIPVLGIDNVVENEFRWTKPRCVTPDKFGEMRRFVVFPGDVLTTIMGTVGRCVVAPPDLPVCISTKHLCVVTVNRKRVHPRYLWGSFLFDADVRRQTQAVGKGAIMEGWNSTIIKRLTIRVPPLPLQKEFAQRVTEIREMEAAQAASRRRLEDLFQSLLHRAFNGEL